MKTMKIVVFSNYSNEIVVFSNYSNENNGDCCVQ